MVRGGGFDGDAAQERSAARRFSDKTWKIQDPQLPKSVWYFTDAQFLGFRIVRRMGELAPKGDSDVRVAGRGQQDSPTDGEKAQSRGNLPGKETGKKEDGYRSLPEFQAGAAAHVKGMIGEGNSNGLVFKGKPSAGKSEISQDEVLASYRRQAEAELNTERVPEALKETIKNYFLSLGTGEGRK